MATTTEEPMNEAVAWKLQGNINYRQGNYQDAIHFYDIGLKADPGNIDILNNKGMALIKLGRIDEARQCQAEIKKVKEHPELKKTVPADVSSGSQDNQKACTVKILGVEVTPPSDDTVSEPSSPGFTDKALVGELQIRDIEQNIELIRSGLDKVRLGRLKESKECNIQIKEMEENIELTRQGLEMVKLGRIEEEKKIKFIEDNLELTRKGLELIKIGRIEEVKYYNQHLKDIEDSIELTRKNLQHVKQTVEGPYDGSIQEVPPVDENSRKPPEPAAGMIQAKAENGSGSAQQITEIEEILGISEDEEQPATPDRVRLASILFIFFVVVLLAYFAFLK